MIRISEVVRIAIAKAKYLNEFFTEEGPKLSGNNLFFLSPQPPLQKNYQVS